MSGYFGAPTLDEEGWDDEEVWAPQAPDPAPVEVDAERVDRMLEPLTGEQRAAVVQPIDDCAVIYAGAGTGKTRVLTTRVAWMICNGVEPRRIIAMTFTRESGARDGRADRRSAAPRPGRRGAAGGARRAADRDLPRAGRADAAQAPRAGLGRGGQTP